jgi:hypothetical protein
MRRHDITDFVDMGFPSNVTDSIDSSPPAEYISARHSTAYLFVIG